MIFKVIVIIVFIKKWNVFFIYVLITIVKINLYDVSNYSWKKVQEYY